MKVFINDRIYLQQTIPFTILQFCFKYDVENIPRFCYHEKLSIAGNCRMCLVEESKSLKPIASCAIQIISNMQIYTNTIKVRKAREGVLEFLLINHPLDCPICDQGGECDLQDITKIYGSDRGRFYEYKRAVFDKNFGPLIKTSMNRCIHCTRCIRYLIEICGISNLGILGRGNTMEIGTYILGFLNTEISGNIIDLCPVGALTSKPYAFRGRPWELKNLYSFDFFNSFLPTIKVCVRGMNILRILPVNSINLFTDNWISDFTRFFYDGLKKQRLLYPIITYFNKNLKIVRVSWRFILLYIKFFFNNELQFLLSNKYKFFEVIFLSSSFSDIYLLITIKKFISWAGLIYKFPINTLSTRFASLFPDFNFLNNAFSLTSGLLLIVGFNLRIDFPILNTQVKNLVSKDNLMVYVLDSWCSYNYFVYYLKNSLQVLSDLIQGKHWLCPVFYKYKHTLFLSSNYKFLLKNFFKNIVFKNNFFFIESKIQSIILSELNLFNPLLQSYEKTYSFSNFILYSVGFDYSYLLKPLLFYKMCNIYQGHTVDFAAFFSKIILPSVFIFEKTSCWLNIYGELKKSTKLLPAAKNSRSDWKILNIIFFLCFKKNLFINLSSIDAYLYHIISPYFQNNKSIVLNLKNFFLKNIRLNFHISRMVIILDNYIYNYLELPIKMSTSLTYSLTFLKSTFIWFK